jgi:hypothetical protein
VRDEVTQLRAGDAHGRRMGSPSRRVTHRVAVAPRTRSRARCDAAAPTYCCGPAARDGFGQGTTPNSTSSVATRTAILGSSFAAATRSVRPLQGGSSTRRSTDRVEDGVPWPVEAPPWRTLFSITNAPPRSG